MKKVFLSALMLTGVMAFAQEPVKPAQPAQVTTSTTTTKEVKPATDAKVAQPADQAKQVKKAETTVKQEKTVEKKADPAKKTN